MTVETTTARWRYPGDGSSTNFAYTNKITAALDLLVYLDGSLQGSGYSVTNVGVVTGGGVIFDSAPALGVQIDIVRLVPAVQGARLPIGGPFPALKVEGMIDRLMLVVQDLLSLAQRTLRMKVDADFDGVSLELPTPVAGRVLAVNSGRSGFEFVEVGGASSVVSIFGRTGIVAAANGDYNSQQIDNTSGVTGGSVSAALNTLNSGQQAVAILARLLTVDGAGSGLDADLLDGDQASAFERVAAKGANNGYAGLDAEGQVPAGQLPDQALIVAVGDETTAITTGTAKVTFRMPYAFTLSEVKASLTTAGTTLTTVDINEAGATLLSTKLTIDANENSSETATAAAVISDAALAADAEITIDIDGAGTSAAGLKVTLIGKPA